MAVCTLDYTLIDWHDIFEYTLESPSGLRWKKRRNGDNAGSVSKRKGTKEPTGWKLNHLRKCYAVHRIIYYMHHGKIDMSLQIDHIDGNPLNNDITNLRLVSQLVNSHNKSTLKTNKSGVPGVHRTVNKGHAAWRGIVRYNGISTFRTFAVNRYGEERAKQMAIDWVLAKRKELNEKGLASFTDRHIGHNLNTLQEQTQKVATLDALFEN